MKTKKRPQFKRIETNVPVQITLWIGGEDLSDAQIEYLKKFCVAQYDNAFFHEVIGCPGEYELVDDETNLADEEFNLFDVSEVVE